MNTETTYSVYLLHATDEPYTPRYVGMTGQKLSARLGGHLSSAYSTCPGRKDCGVYGWIRAVHMHGHRVEISPVLSGLVFVQAAEIEAQMIKYLERSITNREGYWYAKPYIPPPPIVQRPPLLPASDVSSLVREIVRLNDPRLNEPLDW